MKKITLAALSLALMASTSVFAADATLIEPGTAAPSAPTADPQTFTYKAVANRAGFVKNNFEFTTSAHSQVKAVENGTRDMAVGAVSLRGRNLFTGHSDGGSVAQCGDSLDKATATETALKNLLTAVKAGTASDNAPTNGCGDPADPAAAPGA